MKLEACAHCGREPGLEPSFRGGWQVECPNCHDRVLEATSEKVAEKWNDTVLAKRRWLAEESACDNAFAFLKSRADLAPCCRNPNNLDVAQPRPDTLIATCRKCGRKHRKVKMDPGAIALFEQAANLGVRH